ncbi:dihydroorotate dehydrogenase [Xanthomonas arboricola pv. pruni str. MAFF 311562]|uniref:Dihydroorotate dehydrogenase n=1 Tax=Xanthomonas arboricola pv. pruni str. MAFF 311562 TaxID=1414836 RepID=W4SA05_9XANT|nr:dihydroorotate dehydrogenase [Xanthomonas arboricola pv. pruni str. MAFF 311562]
MWSGGFSGATHYYRRIRQFLQVRAYSDGGLKIAARAVYEAAAVMDNPADLINYGGGSGTV